MGSNEIGNIIVGLIVLIGVPVILFLIFRALVLWYWKIDKIVTLLEELVNTTRSNSSSRP